MIAEAKNTVQIIRHYGNGGGVAECSASRIRNPEALGSSSVLTTT